MAIRLHICIVHIVAFSILAYQWHLLGVHCFAPVSRSFHNTPRPYRERTSVFLGDTSFFWEREHATIRLRAERSDVSTTSFVPGKIGLNGPIERTATIVANAAKNYYPDSQAIDNLNTNLDTSYSGNLIDLRLMDRDVLALQIKSLVRVVLPALLWAFVGVLLYPPLSMYLAGLDTYDQGVFAVLSQDASQYVQNILTSSGLMFSISVGYTYYFMYQQQEQIFVHIFAEVSETKTLLEQLSLVCAGRPIYHQALDHMRRYIDELKQVNVLDPALALSQRPIDDPLESLMFLTSVGKPGILYDTIKALREARANRLAAVQRKLPFIHILLLRTLGCVVLVTFPVCGSGSQIIGGDILLHAQAWYFGILVFGIGVVLGVIDELWNPRGGAYNVDGVLAVMIRGTEQELESRQSGRFEELNEPMKWGLESFPPLDDMVELSDSSYSLDETQLKGATTEIRNEGRWKRWRRRFKPIK